MTKKIVFILASLHCVAMTTSIAGMELFSGLLIVAALISFFIPKADIKPTRLGPDWAILVFAVVVIAGAFFIDILPPNYAGEVIREIRWIITLYTFTALFIYLYPEQKKLFLVLSVAASIVAVYSLIQTQTGIDIFRKSPYAVSTYAGMKVWRAKGFFSNTMSYAYSIGLLVCFLLAAWLTGAFTGRAKKVIGIALGLITLALFTTFTRGAWVSIFVAVTGILFLWNWRKAVVATGLFLSLVAAGASVSPPLRERLYSIVQEKPGAKSVSQRKDLWRANWEMFKDYPWLGVGYGQNALIVQEYHHRLLGRDGFVENAHNNYLQVLAGSGVIAFLAWLFFCGYFLWLSLKLWLTNRAATTTGFAIKNDTVSATGSAPVSFISSNMHQPSAWAATIGLGSFGAQIFYHVGGITQCTFFDNEPLHMFIFFWALLISQQKGSGTFLFSKCTTKRCLTPF